MAEPPIPDLDVNQDNMSVSMDSRTVEQDTVLPQNNNKDREETDDVKRFKVLVRLLIENKEADTNGSVSTKLIEVASVLKGQNAIPGLAREALKSLNEDLEKPIDESAFLDYVANLCIGGYQRLGRINLIEIAIECLEQVATLKPEGSEDNFNNLSVLGNMYWNRFDKLHNLSDINTAIEYLERAVEQTPEGHSPKIGIYRDLGLSYRGRFDISHETRDIDLAVVYHAQAVSLVTDESDPDTLTHIGHLGNSHLRRFEYLGEISDLDNAIACHSRASSLTPGEHPYKAGMLNNLGNSHLLRFNRLGELEDLDLTIACLTRAVLLAPDQDKKKHLMLLSLGSSYRTRFDRLGQRIDMEQELECHHQALMLTPDGHSDRAKVLMVLGMSYVECFQHLKNPVDIEKALVYCNEAMELTPLNDSAYLSRQSGLAQLHRARFEILGHLSDLDTSLKLNIEAISSTSEGHTGKIENLRGLGLSYSERYERLGALDDLDIAIAYTREGLLLLPLQNPSRIGWLSNLGSLYGSRLERLGETSDLDMATECYDKAISAMSERRPSKPIVLHGLGNLHQRRFLRLGELSDSDKAITYFSQAESALPTGHLAKLMVLTNLGLSYRTRFMYLGLLPDNEMAIICLNRALSLVSHEQPEQRSSRLHYLGISYSDRFEQTHDSADLDTSLDYLMHAVSLTPDGHARKPERIGSLGVAYMTRFRHSKELVDLNHAIGLQRQALLIMPDGHLRKPTLLNNLGTSYRTRGEISGELADIDTSIAYSTESVLHTPAGDPRRPMFLGNLGHSHFVRFQRLNELHDSETAADCYMKAGHSSSGQPLVRFQMALQWARLLFITDSSSMFDAYTEVMRLIPQAVWLGSTTESRYNQVLNIGSIGIEAASLAMLFNKYDLALEWLEQGRSIVWNQLLELRAPLDRLLIINPHLAQDIKQTAQQLHQFLSPDKLGDESVFTRVDHELAAQTHRQLAQRWDQLVREAQSLPEMQEFLRPKKAEDLLEVCRRTTVVIIIVHEYGCHALVLGENDAVFGHIILKNLTFSKVATARADFSNILYGAGSSHRGIRKGSGRNEPKIEHILKMLWDDLARPVLDFLGYMNEIPSNQLPHITWCPTGPLVSLPLHAAGDYVEKNSTLFSYAVSSYTPNLSSLLTPDVDPAEFSGIAMVGQTSTPGFPPLPGTELELDCISSLGNSTMEFTRIEGDKATSSAVLAAMEQHSWVHLACHASQNVMKPMASAFHLHDRPLDLETIARGELKNADLAFLSACQTATGDHNLPEEAVHLAAGMIMAGYRRVIATMWSIDDTDAPLVAQRFYAYMLDKNMPKENKAARALHHAVDCLRAEIGFKEVARWAPYIHIGL